ncbi:MAG: hypothetical protein GY862_18035 [Gammaproteobacteria bacterium]|nr:hypothetical protein [Gammaproteobacteria bacterium]
MDRREFFQRGFRKVSKAVVKGADALAVRRAARWVRPPHALDELEFLLACTRCGECTAACPHQVIFSLPARLGAQAAGTPALDLLHKGCHLCEDWPCVAACEPGALKRTETEDTEQEPKLPAPLPRIAVAQIDSRSCLPYTGPECGACRNTCPVPGAMRWEQEKPVIVPEHCIGCALCREACILEEKAVSIVSKYKEK